MLNEDLFENNSTISFEARYSELVSMIDTELDRLAAGQECLQKSIFTAMRYSLLAGGKRLRPVLALAVNDLFGGSYRDILPFACAIEMIHTYSLIHDDLPAMDNDDYRRGRLTNHKVFGEAQAILAGDALLNFAFEVMLRHSLAGGDNITGKVKAMNIIANASGANGMIGGQVVDLESEGKKISVSDLEYMHRHKTGALIKAPILSAAAINNADSVTTAALDNFGEKIGLAFQVKDDILDVEGDSKIMGKPRGSDESNQKSTFTTLIGLEESKQLLIKLTNEAVESIGLFGSKAGFLIQLTDFLMKRDK